jgi:hypothetical protein
MQFTRIWAGMQIEKISPKPAELYQGYPPRLNKGCQSLSNTFTENSTRVYPNKKSCVRYR